MISITIIIFSIFLLVMLPIIGGIESRSTGCGYKGACCYTCPYWKKCNKKR